MLYPKSKNKELDLSLFQEPEKEYRGAPFWAWNCKVTKEDIRRCIDALKEMGMGGAHIHSRIGMDMPYLKEEFFEDVHYAHDYAAEKGMLTWLYDEDRWPSGSAGGYVTEKEKNRIRFLVFSPVPLENTEIENVESAVAGQAIRSDNRKLLGIYQVQIKDSFLQSYSQIESEKECADGYDIWYAYREISGDNPWYNNRSYVDTLNPETIRDFISCTHEVYDRELGEFFGKSILSIFTDEPQFCHKRQMKYALEKREVIIPYTDNFENLFQERYGHSFLKHLPEIFWDLPEGKYSCVRYEYHDFVCDLFLKSFTSQVGKWCDDHGILFTGHMMGEELLETQTAALGEAMRCYRDFSLPGIDMLCNHYEYATAKQAASVVHQYGREGMSCEIYGVTNYDFDFRGYKLQGDWLAALGVTVRIHHLAWTSMAGEAKRDYPPSINFQSPWYTEYKYVEDYFARLAVVLTRGTPVIQVGVIHPIETNWLLWGTKETNGDAQKELQKQFDSVIEWLLFGQIDFDFISESLLGELCPLDKISASAFPVGEMRYQVLLVCGCRTLRRSTYERLKRFKESGGKILFMGETPKLLDVKESMEIQEFAKNCGIIPFLKSHLLCSMNAYREIEIREENGTLASHFVHQLRQDGENRWLFIANGKSVNNPDITGNNRYNICIRGLWSVQIFEAVNGDIRRIEVQRKGGFTRFAADIYEHDSLLLKLCPKTEDNDDTEYSEKNLKWVPSQEIISDIVNYQRDEENVFLLDHAWYQIQEKESMPETWNAKRDILSIDNEVRKKYNLPLRQDDEAQPWTDHSDNPVLCNVYLKFEIPVEEKLTNIYLALEGAENAEIWVDDKKINTEESEKSWYVDPAIKKIYIGEFNAGTHKLIARYAFHKKVNLENMFVLGDFDVYQREGQYVLIKNADKIAFGFYTHQGLPFYGGNVIYETEITGSNEKLWLQVSSYRCAVLKVLIDEKMVGYIAYSPYIVYLGELSEGKHSLKIIAYGNRHNTFGALHNADPMEIWYGPNAWRTTGEKWCSSYRLKDMGILKTPVLLKQKEV